MQSKKPQKSWVKKLHDSKNLPKVVKIDKKLSKRWGGGTLAIPSPIEVNSIMQRVPKGRLLTIGQIQKKIAKKHKATMGCPITSGIFSWVSAWAADEERTAGKKNITPYWRTIKTDGEVNPKYPGGVAGQKKLLSKEGHKFEKKGKRILVKDFGNKLIK